MIDTFVNFVATRPIPPAPEFNWWPTIQEWGIVIALLIIFPILSGLLVYKYLLKK